MCHPCHAAASYDALHEHTKEEAVEYLCAQHVFLSCAHGRKCLYAYVRRRAVIVLYLRLSRIPMFVLCKMVC